MFLVFFNYCGRERDLISLERKVVRPAPDTGLTGAHDYTDRAYRQYPQTVRIDRSLERYAGWPDLPGAIRADRGNRAPRYHPAL